MADKWIQLMSENGEDNLFPTTKMDLLWTNASPIAAFAAQTIPLNLSYYKYVYVILNPFYANSSAKISALLSKGEAYQVSGAVNTDYGCYCVSRECTVNDTGVVFSNCGSWSYAQHSVDNAYGIPYRIYGIK